MTVLRAMLLSLLLLAAGCNVAIAEEIQLDTSGGMSAAQSWLAMIDSGRYGASWDAASERFRAAMDRTRWEVMIQTARAPIGLVTSRKLRTATLARSLPNAPDGEYLVIVYDTRFDNLPLATETVTTAREADGAWRIVGYWIR